MASDDPARAGKARKTPSTMDRELDCTRARARARRARSPRVRCTWRSHPRRPRARALVGSSPRVWGRREPSTGRRPHRRKERRGAAQRAGARRSETDRRRLVRRAHPGDRRGELDPHADGTIVPCPRTRFRRRDRLHDDGARTATRYRASRRRRRAARRWGGPCRTTATCSDAPSAAEGTTTARAEDGFSTIAAGRADRWCLRARRRRNASQRCPGARSARRLVRTADPPRGDVRMAGRARRRDSASARTARHNLARGVLGLLRQDRGLPRGSRLVAPGAAAPPLCMRRVRRTANARDRPPGPPGPSRRTTGKHRSGHHDRRMVGERLSRPPLEIDGRVVRDECIAGRRATLSATRVRAHRPLRRRRVRPSVRGRARRDLVCGRAIFFSVVPARAGHCRACRSCSVT